jgi:hypothetical protein
MLYIYIIKFLIYYLKYNINNINNIIYINMEITKLILCMHKNEKAFTSNKDYEIEEDTTNVYYNIDEEQYLYNDKLYKSITYLIYYKENYAIGLFGIFKKNKDLGYHYKDIERVKILYDPVTNKEAYVYMSAHNSEGKWVTWKECDKVCGSLLIYVAKYSHANYHKSGIKWRIFGFANDLCSDGMKTIIKHPSFIRDESIFYIPDQKSKYGTFLKRFFLPIVLLFEKK